MNHAKPGIPKLSIIVPCYNEEEAVASTLASVTSVLSGLAKEALDDYECIFVDDGSTDRTATVLNEAGNNEPSFRFISHDTNRGYGAALKTGVQNARFDHIAIVDADGTYPIDKIPDLLASMDSSDMVVGARIGANVSYPLIRKIPKLFLRRYSSWIAGVNIPDINSGLRVFSRSLALKYLNILPDGFSFTTTITLAALVNRHRVKYLPIDYQPRVGESKIRPIKDTLNFVQLILRTGVYFAPLKVFMPFSALFSGLFAISLTYDIFWLDNITDKSILLLFLAFNTTMFALLADMIDKRSGPA